MKKISSLLFVLLLFCSSAFAQYNPTPNVSLEIPTNGSNNWNLPLNYNFNLLDQYLGGIQAVPNFQISGNLIVGGTVTAGAFAGPGGSLFMFTPGAPVNSTPYFSGTTSPSNTVSGVLLNGIPVYSAGAPPSVAAYTNFVSLFNTGGGTCSGYLKSDGTCDAGGGSVTACPQYTIPNYPNSGTVGTLGCTGMEYQAGLFTIASPYPSIVVNANSGAQSYPYFPTQINGSALTRNGYYTINGDNTVGIYPGPSSTNPALTIGGNGVQSTYQISGHLFSVDGLGNYFSGSGIGHDGCITGVSGVFTFSGVPCSSNPLFSAIQTGTNSTATMHLSGTASIAPDNSGTDFVVANAFGSYSNVVALNGGPTAPGQCPITTSTSVATWQNCGSGSNPAAGPQYALQMNAPGATGVNTDSGLCAQSSGHGLTDCTAGYFSNTFKTNGAFWDAGLAMNTGTPTHTTVMYGSTSNWDLGQNGLFSGVFSGNIGFRYLGDYNSILNFYVNGRGGNANGSDEGHYEDPVARVYTNENISAFYMMYTGTISAVSQPVANGPAALTLAISSGGTRMTNDTLLVDQTSVITSTLTLPATTTSAGSPLVVTSSATVPVSNSGTLNADTVWTPASYLDVTPTLTTFQITNTATGSAADAVGTRLCFADANVNISEPGTQIVSISTSGSVETISAYLMKPHYAGAQVYTGGMCGYAYELTADTHNGQKYMIEIYGSTGANTLVAGSRSFGNYQVFGNSGPANIYPAARIITTYTSPGAAPDGTYAQIIPPTGAFTAGATIVNPGFPNQRIRIQQTSSNWDDPYSSRGGWDYSFAGYGQNWQYPLHRWTFNPASMGLIAPVLNTYTGAVGAGDYFQHQLYGNNGSNSGISCTGNAFICVNSWDPAGPSYQDLIVMPFFDITAQYNPQTVTSCSIVGSVMTLSGTFNLSYISVGMPIFIQNFTDGSGGCSDFNTSGNINNKIVTSASTSSISVALGTTHANYTGSGNTGQVATALWDFFHNGQSSINVYAVGAKRLNQNGNQACDTSGTVAGCAPTQLTGTTSTITGTVLSASCDSGTVTVSGATVGHTVGVSSTTGADVGGAFNLRASVTAANTITVYVCGTGTPASMAYNVTTY